MWPYHSASKHQNGRGATRRFLVGFRFFQSSRSAPLHLPIAGTGHRQARVGHRDHPFVGFEKIHADSRYLVQVQVDEPGQRVRGEGEIPPHLFALGNLQFSDLSLSSVAANRKSELKRPDPVPRAVATSAPGWPSLVSVDRHAKRQQALPVVV